MNKKIVHCAATLLLLIVIASGVHAQVNWKTSVRQLGKNRYAITISAALEESWHLYSQTTPGGGPFPASVVFASNPVVKPEGKVVEQGQMISRYEEAFGVEVKYYNEFVEFVQVVTTKEKTELSGIVKYMVCNDTQCLPPMEYAFKAELK